VYNSLPDKSIKTWDDFHKVFMKTCGTKRNPRMLLLQFNEIKKKENETIEEFDARFESLLQQIPDNISPKDDVVLLLYTNSFEGKFGFMLKDKSPKNLREAQEQAAKIKGNLLASKVESFHAPRAKA